MKRRDLVRGVASTGLIAIGASAASGASTDPRSGGGTHLSIRQEDGSRRIVRKADLDAEPDCTICDFAEYCFQCDPDCDCCDCQTCC